MAKRKKPPKPALTDAEINRINREWEAVPPELRLAWSRKFNVEKCLRWRAAIKAGPKVLDDGSVFTVELMTFMLRQCQKQLLKLRIWRATGHYPSSDN
jgi:hypothetical protein